jgi:hypothetical protein
MRDPLGRTRREVVENLAAGYTYRKHASDLARMIAERTTERAEVRKRVLALLSSPGDLDDDERRALDDLARKYHPLR